MKLKSASEVRASLSVEEHPSNVELDKIAQVIEEVKRKQNFIIWGHPDDGIVEHVIKVLKIFKYVVDNNDSDVPYGYTTYRISW